MIALHYYLDTRASKDGPAPLKLAIGKRSSTAYLPTEFRLLPANWDAKTQRIIGLPRARIMNEALERMKADVRDYLRPLIFAGDLADLTATGIKRLVDEHLYGEKIAPITLNELWNEVMKEKTEHSLKTYASARKRIEKTAPELFSSPARSISEEKANDVFAQLDEDGISTSYRNIAAQTMKVLFNDGMKMGLVKTNPFANIKKPYVQTRKRDLSAEQLRSLLNVETKTKGERMAIDLFLLSFLLRAINPADIWTLAPENEFNGRIDYIRAKTGKYYTVKVEPEAKALIEKYRNKKHLFAPVEKFASCSTMASVVNMNLKKLSERCGLPQVSLYWARHSLASIAFELGVPVDIVSAILGHSVGARVTMGYVDIKVKQVDDAARKVYDYVLYGKK